jgi:AraC-like DNA-binding protein
MKREYYLPQFDELNFFCFPHSVGRYTYPDHHNVRREAGVRDFSLHFIVGGKGYIELNDTVYTLKRGDAFLHVPFQRMRYYTSEDDRWDIFWMQFNGSKLMDHLLERGFHDSAIWFHRIIGLLPAMQQKSHLPFIMDNWADKAELTPNYFCSLFKKVTKMTPLAYIYNEMKDSKQQTNAAKQPKYANQTNCNGIRLSQRKLFQQNIYDDGRNHAK